jgi:gluconate 2-dehydrogenase gamma chain
MRPDQPDRRSFLLHMSGTAAAAWVNAQWPVVLAAAQHAHEAVHSKASKKFEALTAEQARQVEAIASQIIPKDDLPGAREAGVVYFIDRALMTFAADTRPIYEKGIAAMNQLTATKYPTRKSFADATAEEQETILTEFIAGSNYRTGRPEITPEPSGDFFRTIRMHTIFGFLADPSAGGNRDYAGWKVVGRDPSPSFLPPYGYYDEDYPGWQAVKAEMEKK